MLVREGEGLRLNMPRASSRLSYAEDGCVGLPGPTPSRVQITQPVPAPIPHSPNSLWFNVAPGGACSGQRVRTSSAPRSWEFSSKVTRHSGLCISVPDTGERETLPEKGCSSDVLTYQGLPKPERWGGRVALCGRRPGARAPGSLLGGRPDRGLS